MKRVVTTLVYAVALLLLPVVAGCTAGPQEEPTATATTVAVPSPTLQLTDTAAPAATASPSGAEPTATTPAATTTPAPGATAEPAGQALLPAPVYYLNNGQIFRLEADGRTVTRTTSESAPVIDYDVHPGTGLLVYVSGNDLIQADAGGGNRQVLIQGSDFADDDYAARFSQRIDNPRIAPDGSQIAFGLNGVNVIASGDASGNYTVLQPSDPYPETPAGVPEEGPTRFFWPVSWSPDGNSLLVEFAYYPEAGGLAIYHMGDGSLAEIANPDYISVGDWTWGNDSQSGFIASNVVVYGSAGLARVDAGSGNSTTLIKGMPDGEVNAENPARLFQTPHQTAGGDLFTFAQEETVAQYLGSSPTYQIYRVSPDGSMMTPVREEAYYIGDVLWADNDLGAIFVDRSNDREYPYTGPMRWVPVDGGPVLDLAANGSNPRWGGAPTVPAAGPADAALEALVEHFKSTLDLQPEAGVQDVVVRPLVTTGQDLWLVHTVGMRGFDPLQPHVVAAYRNTPAGWEEAGRLAFPDGGPQLPPGPDYLNEGSVHQVFVEPSHTWVTVDGGVGAHGGTFHLLRHDGSSFTVAAAHGNASPGAGWVADVNGDTRQEVILDQSDAYVFAYASGVRLVNYELLRWNGSELETVGLVCCQGSGEAWELNDRAVTVAEAELWQDARELIGRARSQAPGDEIIAWNAALINLIAGGRENAIGPYPLLGNIFFGTYERAVDTMRSYAPAELFSDSPPFVAGTAAEGWLDSMVEKMLVFSEKALSAKPDLAPAHFIRGWALYQADPGDPAALESVRQAQSLSPDDPLYNQSANYLSP